MIKWKALWADLSHLVLLVMDGSMGCDWFAEAYRLNLSRNLKLAI
jgi:hypothetical protein